jgi:AbrB family looped-hinge helix DNA binding protein
MIVRKKANKQGGHPMTTATLTSKGQITIPVVVRNSLHLKPGDTIDFQVEENGTARLLPLSKRVADVYGILESKGREPVTVEEMDKRLKEKFQERKI